LISSIGASSGEYPDIPPPRKGQPLRGGASSDESPDEDSSLEAPKEEIKSLSSLPTRKLKAALRTGP
jgi:hypothetical protein